MVRINFIQNWVDPVQDTTSVIVSKLYNSDSQRLKWVVLKGLANVEIYVDASILRRHVCGSQEIGWHMMLHLVQLLSYTSTGSNVAYT